MIFDLFSRPSLDKLALRYRTDKNHQVHNFAQFYDRHFEPLREKPITLLEIGVGRGASLRMWNKYFKRADIYAVESEPRRNSYRHLCKKLFLGRQEDPIFLRSVMEEIGPADIIIDDGSHHVRDQQITLGCLFPFLREGGHYILEDIHTSFWSENEEFGVARDESNSTYQMLKDFQKSGKFSSQYLSPNELESLDRSVGKITFYAHQDERQHLTSLLEKRRSV